ncbi:MARVEL domain-containing protein 1-like [Octopus sinensis]|uniref:MARVEL domain-containing protein 1-like n=1 Tax=Octopus sinensis TaxID=2607531 RepID=A0A6P7TVX3_9MOLL|nr:MARVEL domain-containing protein 1-like [Octopus sinensis]XP_036370795.1 MARVEL domain-containing protein 1-like [Octopus sinensis]
METYGHTTTSTTTSTTTTVAIGPDISYAKSLRGILKLAEIFISILTLICASVAIQYAIAGVGWVQFVAVVTFIIFITFFLLHFLHIFARIPAPMLLIEFAVYVGSCVCIFIAAVVAACYGFVPSLGAAAFFLFATLAVAAYECVYLYRDYKGARHPSAASPDMANVESTTTTTTYETRPQY